MENVVTPVSDELRQRREAIVRQHLDAENRQDVGRPGHVRDPQVRREGTGLGERRCGIRA
jgi:hypothetical protein